MNLSASAVKILLSRTQNTIPFCDKNVYNVWIEEI